MPLAPPWVPVDFYFTDSNIIIPHSALKGATPEEMFTGIWTLEKIKQINERITAAKILRIESNTSSRCGAAIIGRLNSQMSCYAPGLHNKAVVQVRKTTNHGPKIVSLHLKQ